MTRIFGKISKLGMFVFSFSLCPVTFAMQMSECQKCDPAQCDLYSHARASQCVEHCGSENSAHAESVVDRCYERMNALETEKTQPINFPNSCARATKNQPLEGLVAMEGLIVPQPAQGGTFRFQKAGEHREEEMYYKISPNAGHIGTGHDKYHITFLSGTTPYDYRVMAHVNPHTREVMCLSEAYKMF